MPSAIVTLPDGSKARVTGETREAVLAQAQAMSQSPRPAPVDVPGIGDVQFPSSMSSADVQDVLGNIADRQAKNASIKETFGRAAATRFLDNVIGIPNLIATAGGRMLLGLPLVDRPAPLPQGVDPRINAPLVDLPEVGDRVLPLPTGAQVVAGAETAAKLPGALMAGQPADIANRFQLQLAADQRAAQANPVSTFAGGTAGDILTLLTGRAGVRSATRIPPGSVVPFKAAKVLKPGARAALNQIVSGKLANSFTGGLKKAAETGLEGATLAVLNEGDPLKTAAFAAGSQAAGSLALSALNQIRKRSLPSTILGLAMAYQMWKTIGPGQRDLFDASDKAFSEVAGVYGLGLLAALAGMGRIGRSGFAENFPALLTDSLTAIPRGAVVSVIKDLNTANEKNDDAPQRVVEKLSEDPGYFGPGARVRIERALKSGKEGALLKEIDSLMKIKAFRDKLDEAE